MVSWFAHAVYEWLTEQDVSSYGGVGSTQENALEALMNILKRHGYVCKIINNEKQIVQVKYKDEIFFCNAWYLNAFNHVEAKLYRCNMKKDFHDENKYH